MIGIGLSQTGQRQGQSDPEVMLTRGYSLIVMSDPHIGAPVAHPTQVRTCLDWAQATAVVPVGLLVAGDMDECPTFTPGFATWARDPAGGNLAAGITILPVIGNHDTEVPWNGDHDVTPALPHATIQGRYPTLFRGREYYKWDHESLRIIVLNNLTDYLDADGHSAYYNCNPPGSEHSLNPDHSGITDAASAQRLWLARAPVSAHPWKIIACHRSLWAPFDEDPRKLHRAARPVMGAAIDAGVSLICQGDTHVGSLSGPWYPTAPDYEEHRNGGAVAAYAMTLCGGFVPRDVDSHVLPDHAHTCPWASGGSTTTGLAQIAILQFEGDVAALSIFECSADTPAGSVVYQTTLTRNPGV